MPLANASAVAFAIDKGFGIEIDLQLSADDQAIVFHDYGLERLTGVAGTVRTKTAAELAQIPLIGGSDGVPTLQDILDLVAGRVPLLIELKDQDGAMGPNIGPLEQATVDALREYEGPVGLMSFNPNTVAALADLAPHMPRGLVTCDYAAGDWPLSDATCARLREIPDYGVAQASFLSHQHTDLARPRVAELKSQGADILCWTIRSEAEAREALKIAQNITFEGYLPS